MQANKPDRTGTDVLLGAPPLDGVLVPPRGGGGGELAHLEPEINLLGAVAVARVQAPPRTAWRTTPSLSIAYSRCWLTLPPRAVAYSTATPRELRNDFRRQHQPVGAGPDEIDLETVRLRLHVRDLRGLPGHGELHRLRDHQPLNFKGKGNERLHPRSLTPRRSERRAATHVLL